MRLTSSTSLIRASRCPPAVWIDSAYSAYRSGTGPNRRWRMMSEKPITAFRGVRSSWLMWARKRDLPAFWASASARAASSSASRACCKVASSATAISRAGSPAFIS
ncbi:hypothetical protein D3C72_1150090 [compost metagenome]